MDRRLRDRAVELVTATPGLTTRDVAHRLGVSMAAAGRVLVSARKNGLVSGGKPGWWPDLFHALVAEDPRVAPSVHDHGPLVAIESEGVTFYRRAS